MRKYKGKVVIQFDKDFNYVNSFDSTLKASRETSIDQQCIYNCAKFWSMNCNRDEWKKIYKKRPQKQAGGYIWRFYSDFENRD